MARNTEKLISSENYKQLYQYQGELFGAVKLKNRVVLFKFLTKRQTKNFCMRQIDDRTTVYFWSDILSRVDWTSEHKKNFESPKSAAKSPARTERAVKRTPAKFSLVRWRCCSSKRHLAAESAKNVFTWQSREASRVSACVQNLL